MQEEKSIGNEQKCQRPEFLAPKWGQKLQTPSTEILKPHKCDQLTDDLGVTNKLDGSEDHLISDRIIKLIGPNLMKFCEELLKEKPKSFRELLQSITPPKGIVIQAMKLS